MMDAPRVGRLPVTERGHSNSEPYLSIYIRNTARAEK